MKFLVLSLFILSAVISQAALACGGMKIPEYSPNAKAELNPEYRGYPKEVLQGVAYSLFEDSWDDYTSPEGREEFFQTVAEMELLRKKHFYEPPYDIDYYIQPNYIAGKFNMVLSEEAAQAIKKFPLLDSEDDEDDEVGLKYYDVNGSTQMPVFDAVIDYYGMKKMGHSEGNEFLTQIHIWTNPFLLYRNINEKFGKGIVLSGERSLVLCNGGKQKVKRIGDGVYGVFKWHTRGMGPANPKNQELKSIDYYRVDLVTKTVKFLSSIDIR